MIHPPQIDPIEPRAPINDNDQSQNICPSSLPSADPPDAVIVLHTNNFIDHKQPALFTSFVKQILAQSDSPELSSLCQEYMDAAAEAEQSSKWRAKLAKNIEEGSVRNLLEKIKEQQEAISVKMVQLQQHQKDCQLIEAQIMCFKNSGQSLLAPEIQIETGLDEIAKLSAILQGLLADLQAQKQDSFREMGKIYDGIVVQKSAIGANSNTLRILKNENIRSLVELQDLQKQTVGLEIKLAKQRSVLFQQTQIILELSKRQQQGNEQSLPSQQKSEETRMQTLEVRSLEIQDKHSWRAKQILLFWLALCLAASMLLALGWSREGLVKND